MVSMSSRWAAGLCAVVAGVLWMLPARAALVSPDFQIGPNISLDSLSVGAGTQKYLVVWRDLSNAPASTPMSGSLVGTTGIASAAFTISDAAAMPQIGPVQRARVAFDGTNFLVVWHDLRTLGSGVRAALVSQQGVILGGADFLVSATTNSQGVNPQAVFTGDDYLIAWQDAPLSGNGQQVFFTRVSTAGTAGAITSVPPISGPDFSQQLELLIPGATNALGQAVIVYQDIAATPNATYAVRLGTNNSITGPASGTMMFTHDFSTTGAGVPVGGAYLNDTSEFLILASRGTPIDCFVSRAWLRTDGSVGFSTAPFALVGQGNTTLTENDFPLAFYNGTDEFIFPRNSEVSDVAYHVFIKRVGVDQTDNDPYMAVVDTASSGILNGAAAAAIGNQYLVVWMDGRRRVADPPQQTNVFGALIDGTQPGLDIRPYIRPGPAAAPIVGDPPLTVSFSAGTSTGLIDGGNWNFGDGTTSILPAVTHKYTAAGSYMAIFTLFKSGLDYNTFVNIDVASNDIGGAGGPPQTIGGVASAASPGVNTQVACDGFTATLNFTKSNDDTFRMSGVFDVSRIPLYLTGQNVAVTVGTNSYSFNLLADGTFVSTSGTVPFLNFSLDQLGGSFLLAGSSDSLLSALAGSGVANIAATKIPVSIPVSISFAGMSMNQKLTAQYTAKAGVTGRITYVFGTTGTPGDGIFFIADGTAVERLTVPKTGTQIHDFTLDGNITPPNGVAAVAASTGAWTITVGNYTQSIPVSSLKFKNNIYTFTGTRVTSGITQFGYNTKSGGFVVSLKAIPSFGEDASGMALSINQVLRADLAISVDLAIANGGEFKAGSFLRLGRADPTKTKWKTR